ncbi:MAG: fructose-1,6-bisphosphatase [Campylobacterales bacterium]|nr:fructose-1,6-bisphosphatase [Campylobacterales bacterium]
MIEVFNGISNIAVAIEKEVFANYDGVIEGLKEDVQIENKVYQYCSNLIEKECESIKSVKSVISKDKKQMCQINENGKYIIAYTAIDTMSLLEANFSLGSIFAIYENKIEAHNLVACIYVTYGPTFQMVFGSKSEGVKYFSYEHGEFVQKDDLKLNEKGKINTPSGGFDSYTQDQKKLTQSFFDDGYRLRFSNSLCLDTHQILFKKGGIFMSPSTFKNQSGVLELVFEAYPMALIIELAGGRAIDGSTRILDLKLDSLHQTSPIYFGSVSEVNRVETFYK